MNLGTALFKEYGGGDMFSCLYLSTSAGKPCVP
jgi:hypothetical protein